MTDRLISWCLVPTLAKRVLSVQASAQGQKPDLEAAAASFNFVSCRGRPQLPGLGPAREPGRKRGPNFALQPASGGAHGLSVQTPVAQPHGVQQCVLLSFKKREKEANAAAVSTAPPGPVVGAGPH